MKPLTAVGRAATKAAQAAQDRDDAICEAHAQGHTIREIAVVAGLSFQRVHQIIHGR